MSERFDVAGPPKSNSTEITFVLGVIWGMFRRVKVMLNGVRRDADAFTLMDGTYLELEETTDPPAPAANRARVYARDNGAGKTQLCVRFPTGAVQVLSTEP